MADGDGDGDAAVAAAATKATKAAVKEQQEAGLDVLKPPETSSVDIRIAMIGNVDRCVLVDLYRVL